MLRPLLLAALTSLVLVSVARAPVHGDTPDPDDLCTFTLQAEDSVYVEFLAAGGGGAGRDVYCPMGYEVNPDTAGGVDGPEDYSYLIYVHKEDDEDAARARVPAASDGVTATHLGAVGGEYGASRGDRNDYVISTFARDRYFVHGQAMTGRGASAGRLSLLLTYVDNQIQIVLGEASEPEEDADAEQPPDVAEDGAAEDGDDQRPVNVESDDLLTRTIVDSLLSAEDFIDCGPDSGQTLSQECDGLVQAVTAGVRIRPAFLGAVGVVDLTRATKLEEDAADLLATTVSMAAAEGRDGLPLYPSLRVALPIIVKLSAAAAVDDASLSALAQLVQLLGSRDQDTWEERF